MLGHERNRRDETGEQIEAERAGCEQSGLEVSVECLVIVCLRITRLHVPVISRLSLVDGGFYGERTWLPGRPVDLAILAGRVTPTGSTLAGICSSSPGSALRSTYYWAQAVRAQRKEVLELVGRQSAEPAQAAGH